MKQIKQLQRLLGKKTMENELLKEAVALVASGSLVRNCMPWSVGRSTGRIVDAGACRMILKRWPVSILLSGLCPPMVIVVYGHCCADNQKHDDMAEINAKIPHHASECAAA